MLNVEANVEVDFTARVKQDLLVRLRAFGLAKTIGPGLLFPTLPSAVDAYRHWAAAHPPLASKNPDGSDHGTTSGPDA